MEVESSLGGDDTPDNHSKPPKSPSISLEIHWKMYAEVDASDPTGLRDKIGETVYQGWLELDAVLARLWESHSIRLELVYVVPRWSDRRRAGRLVRSLLPEVMTSGIIDLVERCDG